MLNDTVDPLTGKSELDSWIYPANKTFRTYQFKIVRTCLFENTLVTLPTGLGKTFIASTVIYNFWRWFTDGLIFFVAPTKPLVSQQAQSFASTITEIPLPQICELTGNQPKKKRIELYQSGRVFFMTPQTLQSDIESRLFDQSKVVCLIIDEAHRATGNYAYCNIINNLEKANVGFRIVSLSATPVSKIENLQAVVTSLRCSMFEVRDEDDDEIKQFTYAKNILEILVEKENNIAQLETLLYQLMMLPMEFVKAIKVMPPYMQPKYLTVMSVRDLV